MPKGIPNKKKVVKEVKEESKPVVKPVVKAEEKPASGNCKECKHASDKHYGNEAKWCNIQFCQCQALS